MQCRLWVWLDMCSIHTHIYHNGSLEYFGPEHHPHTFLAIFCVHNIQLCLSLCLYPCQCCHAVHGRLNCCRLNRLVRYCAPSCMDAFQGCYKFEPSMTAGISLIFFLIHQEWVEYFVIPSVCINGNVKETTFSSCRFRRLCIAMYMVFCLEQTSKQ